MLNAHVPTILALLGTVLMAIVIFAPAPSRATVTASLAPPVAAHRERVREPQRDDALFDALERPRADDAYAAWQSFATHDAVTPFGIDHVRAEEHEDDPRAEGHDDVLVRWPILVDARAGRCDAAGRIAVAGALGELGTPWSHGVLRAALDEEPDPSVRDAVAQALGDLRSGESSLDAPLSAKPLPGARV